MGAVATPARCCRAPIGWLKTLRCDPGKLEPNRTYALRHDQQRGTDDLYDDDLVSCDYAG
jgi:hypothetical protein